MLRPGFRFDQTNRHLFQGRAGDLCRFTLRGAVSGVHWKCQPMTTNPSRTKFPRSTTASTQAGIAGSPGRDKHDSGAQTPHPVRAASSVSSMKRIADRSGVAAQLFQEIHPHRPDDYAHFGLNE